MNLKVRILVFQKRLSGFRNERQFLCEYCDIDKYGLPPGEKPGFKTVHIKITKGTIKVASFMANSVSLYLSAGAKYSVDMDENCREVEVAA
jgi:hypothetical protein